MAPLWRGFATPQIASIRGCDVGERFVQKISRLLTSTKEPRPITALYTCTSVVTFKQSEFPSASAYSKGTPTTSIAYGSLQPF